MNGRVRVSDAAAGSPGPPDPDGRGVSLQVQIDEAVAARLARRTASEVSVVVHVLLLVALFLLPRFGSVGTGARPIEVLDEPRIPVTFQEFRPRVAGPRGGEENPFLGRDQEGPLAPAVAQGENPLAGARPGTPAPPEPPADTSGGSVLPDDPRGTRPPAPASSVPGGRRIDVEDALRQFRNAVPPAPPGEARGRGTGDAGVRTGGGAPALPTTGFSAGSLEFESGDYDWTDYYRQIYVIIWRAWHSRLHQTTDRFERFALAERDWMLHHTGRVRFTIQRNGQVVGVTIEDGSGCGPLDDATADTLREVVLPPLPADFPRDAETVRYLFSATGDVRGMARTLDYLHERGYF